MMTAKGLKLDYFKLYDIENREGAIDVWLKGQFDKKEQRMGVRILDRFANPVSKNGEPLYDKNAHLALYRGIVPAEPTRSVVLENQFGAFEVVIGACVGMLVPTEKVEKGSAFPKGLDHFKVYRVLHADKVPDKVVGLKDQFGSDEVKLGPPVTLAVPVAKRVGDKKYPIQNERAHLLIFPIDARDIQKTIKIQNQFARGPRVLVVRSLGLGVPSVKKEWKQL